MDVTWSGRPRLAEPVLVAAFRGWSDAADAASMAVEFVERAWCATPFASIDSEEFFDFKVRRPVLTVPSSGPSAVAWPETIFKTARVPSTARDAVLLCGVEPSTRWRRFIESVLSVVGDTGVGLVVTLGALLSDVPHTRPVRVTGSSSDKGLAARLGLETPRYQGPIGIAGVLHDALQRAGVPTLSLWAATPHYLRDTPSPKAALELVRRLGAFLEVAFDTADLESRSAEYERVVDLAVAGDRRFGDHVNELERAWDDGVDDAEVSAESIAQEIERYLRDLGQDD